MSCYGDKKLLKTKKKKKIHIFKKWVRPTIWSRARHLVPKTFIKVDLSVSSEIEIWFRLTRVCKWKQDDRRRREDGGGGSSVGRHQRHHAPRRSLVGPSSQIHSNTIASTQIALFPQKLVHPPLYLAILHPFLHKPLGLRHFLRYSKPHSHLSHSTRYQCHHFCCDCRVRNAFRGRDPLGPRLVWYGPHCSRGLALYAMTL